MTTKDGKQSVQQATYNCKQSDKDAVAVFGVDYVGPDNKLHGEWITGLIGLFSAHRQALITRLAEPDDAMIEAVARAMQIENRPKSQMLNSEQQACKEEQTIGGYRELAKAALAAAANVLEG